MKSRIAPNLVSDLGWKVEQCMILAVRWPCAIRAAYDGRVTLPPDTASPPVLTVEGAVARIALARPGQHNAIEAVDVDEMRAHLARVEADRTVRALIVTGHGATFCAGASLPAIERGDMSGELFQTLTSSLDAVRVPSICALNGSAHGGGTELALCCDFRIGVLGSSMSVPAGRLGLCYPAGGLRRFVEALGPGVAKRLLLAGEELSAEEMLDVGFLHLLVPREELRSAADALASRLASQAPLAVQGMKRILRQIAGGDLDEEEAKRLVAACAASEDLREGLAARRERRPPEFRGT
jgi:enoyl-CoA hydratase/carnithine racemase